MRAVKAPAPSTTFASLLTSIAAPAQKVEQEWDNSALADDVATISYEEALRTHSRFRTSAADDVLGQQNSSPAAEISTTADPLSSQLDRKQASITIRMSQAECAQLRQRASDAGLSVSAYLRSCVFEVETLRTQVREALSQFRSATNDTRQSSKPVQPLGTWKSRLIPRWSRSFRGALPEPR